MLNKPRLVVDTNVLVSRALQTSSVPSRALARANELYQLIHSSETLAELNAVLSRPKFQPYITPDGRRELIFSLLRNGTYLRQVAPVAACRDPKYDKFLSLAIAGEASLIMTRDKDLLVLNPFQNIEILSPRDYLTRYP